MIIVDVETTGLDGTKCTIVDFAAMDFDNPDYVFSSPCRYREGATVEGEALKFNGLSLDEIMDPSKPSLEEVCGQFVEWSQNVKDRTIAGQNVDFDMLFMRYAFAHYAIPWDFGIRKIDQHTLAYDRARTHGIPIPLNKYRTSDFKSDSIMEFVGIPPEPRPHRAVNGVIGRRKPCPD